MKTESIKSTNNVHASVRTQWIIYFVLLGLLGATVAVAYVPLGWLNLGLAALIAFWKAGLVVWYFMHMREAEPIDGLMFGASLFMIAVAIILSLTDYLTRS